MTARERVLRLLRERGEQGLNVIEMLDPVDGGKPVTRLAARINELRDDGYQLETRRQKNSTATYVLVAEPLEREAA